VSANYYGETTVRCYHDCKQSGCPSHRIRLVEKHGGYFVEIWRGDKWERGADFPYDLAWFDACCRLRGLSDTPASAIERHRAQLEMTLREVRAELLADGYHRPNEMILKIDAALGEDA
jgi:hypothetical protein